MTKKTDTDILENIAAAHVALQTAKKDLKASDRALMKKLFTEVFDAHPKAGAYQWRQWTPGFNDGDPCRFTVDDGDISHIAEIDDFERKDGEDEEELINALNAFDGIIGTLGDDLLEGIFGNDVEVTVTREGIDVTDWECGY